MNIDKKILEIYDEINKSKKSILQTIGIREAVLGAPLDSIKVNSAYGPRGGREHNGVDFAADAANVKSPADGVVEIGEMKNDDCGGTITINHADGYKTGYCHMQKINVRSGQKVSKGDIVGVSGGGSNDPGKGRSDGRHLHFTLRKDGQLVDPMSYIGKEGIVSSGSASEDAYNYATSSNTTKPSSGGYAQVVGSIKSVEGLSEQRNFGKNVSNRYGRVVIPKDDNSKIKSPISGVINNKKYFASCKNQVTIENIDNGTVYLQFCGISSPSSFRNGESVRIGTLLGTTDTDVEVNMYDSNWSRISIPEKDLTISSKDKVKDLEDTKRKNTESEYYDPIMAALMGLPSKIFQDKFDKSGNRTEKRYGGVADKQEVDPFVLNFLKDPFKRKKVNEDIEKIKKML